MSKFHENIYDRLPSLPSSSYVLCFFLLRTKKDKTNTAIRKLTTVTGMAILATEPDLFFLAEGSTGGSLLTEGMKSARFKITGGIQRDENRVQAMLLTVLRCINYLVWQ